MQHNVAKGGAVHLVHNEDYALLGHLFDVCGVHAAFFLMMLLIFCMDVTMSVSADALLFNLISACVLSVACTSSLSSAKLCFFERLRAQFDTVNKKDNLVGIL